MDWGIIVLSLVAGFFSFGAAWIYLRGEAERRRRSDDRLAP